MHLVDRDQVEIVAVHSEIGGERGRALQVVGELDIRQKVIITETVVVDEERVGILVADLVPICREDLGHDVPL